MPVAVVTNETTRYDLKSLEGAYVEIKPLPYGQRLSMRDRASRMSMEAEGGRRGRKNDVTKIDIDMLQGESRKFEFANCIVDHNLEDVDGKKLDFTNPDTIARLHPKVGSEIERYLDQINEIEDEGELENLNGQPSTSIMTPPKSDLDAAS